MEKVKNVLIFLVILFFVGILFFKQPLNVKEVSAMNTFQSGWCIYGLRDRDDIRYFVEVDSAMYLIISDARAYFYLKSIKVFKMLYNETKEETLLTSPYELNGKIYIPIKNKGTLILPIGENYKTPAVFEGRPVIMYKVTKI